MTTSTDTDNTVAVGKDTSHPDAQLPARRAGHPRTRPLAAASGELTAQGTAPQLDPGQEAALAKARRQAAVVRELGFAANMACAVPLGGQVQSSGYKVYLDEFVRDAGNPADPVERILLEQLALAHHRVAELHARAGRADSVEMLQACSAAAARLTGEVRRLALALRQYRHPIPQKFVTFVKQQNVAGRQQVGYLDQTGVVGEAPSRNLAGELASNSEPRKLSHAPNETFTAESKTSRRRTPQPAAARTTLGGGS